MEVTGTVYTTDGFCSLEKSIGDAKAQILQTVGDGTCATIKAVGDAECSTLQSIGENRAVIVDRMGTYASDSFKNASDIAQRQAIALTAVERDLQNQILTNRYETAKLNTELSRYLADKTDNVKDHLIGFERNTDLQFQGVSTAIEKAHAAQMLENAKSTFELSKAISHSVAQGIENTTKIVERLDSSERRALQDELNETRLECLTNKLTMGVNSQFALASADIASLKNMVNSVDQNQKFSSKIVQFGNGDYAKPTQTANQG